MGNLANIRRFRVNPIETVIFLVVVGGFLGSIYNLMYHADSYNIGGEEIAQTETPNISREIASVPQSFVNLEIFCDKMSDQETGAAKVRLTGRLCGVAEAAESSQLIKTSISNGANKFAATVFTDISSGKFSTDYIPLNLGKNPIHVEFSYRDGKVVSQDFNIVKN